MNAILETLTAYYGLDWISMLFGLSGTYLITVRNRAGFLCSGLACALGLTVATMSSQTGYMVYNFILMSMMLRAFIGWNRQPA